MISRNLGLTYAISFGCLVLAEVETVIVVFVYKLWVLKMDIAFVEVLETIISG